MCLLLSGCWDKVEIENRAFVLSLGIDKYSEKQDSEISPKENMENRFSVSIAMPQTEDSSSENDENINKVKTSSNVTISSAMQFSGSHSSQKLFFGHTKLAVFGSELLKNSELFRETIDTFERTPEISRKILILSTDNEAEEVLGFKESSEPVSMFISNFYKNNINGSAVTFKQTLENLVLDLRTSGNTIIPKVTVEDKSLQVGGAAIIKDFEFVDWIEGEEMRGYLFVKEGAEGANVMTEFEDTFVPLEVTKNKAQVTFLQTSDGLVCNIYVKVDGTVDEFKFTEEVLATEENLSELSHLYRNKIESDIESCLSKFEKHDVDGFALKEYLRKRNYDLYEIYGKDNNDFYNQLIIVPLVEVNVRGTGSVI